MSSPRLVLSHGTAHALIGGEVACGAEPEEVTERPYPDGERRVCRECSRAVATAGSTVPLGSFGRGKRPGGM